MDGYEARLLATREQCAPALLRRVDEIERAAAADDGDGVAALALGLAGGAHLLELDAIGDAAAAAGSAAAGPQQWEAAIRALRAALGAAGGSSVRFDHRRLLNHDLRSPLTVVLGYAGLLRDHPLDPSAAAMVDGILEAGTTMRELLDEDSAALDLMADAAPSSSSASASASGSGVPDPWVMDVLVVDDDPLVRNILVAVLHSLDGVAARAAATPEAAVVAIEEREPELLVVDLRPHGADATRFLPEARRMCPSTFIAVLTGDDPSPHREELRGLGADIVVRNGPPSMVRLLVDAARPSR